MKGSHSYESYELIKTVDPVKVITTLVSLTEDILLDAAGLMEYMRLQGNCVHQVTDLKFALKCIEDAGQELYQTKQDIIQWDVARQFKEENKKEDDDNE